MAVRRSQPASLTLKRARAAADAVGVTRLAEVTGFDLVGIPVMQAIRPRSRSLSVSQGKGRSRLAASVSALMEALELDAAERRTADLAGPAQPDEKALWQEHLRNGAGFPGESIPWLEGRNLLTGRACRIPLWMVSLNCAEPFDPAPGASGMGAVSTGIAGGNNRAEAVVTALAEIREREALFRFQQADPRTRRSWEVCATALEGREARWATARIARAGLGLRVWDLAPGEAFPIRLAVILAGPGLPRLAPALGISCGIGAASANFGALAEAAQARVTLLAGARDDILPQDYADPAGRTMRLLLGSLSLGAARVAPAACPPPPTSLEAAQDGLLAALEASGAAAIAVASLAEHPGPLDFVKAVAPGVPDGERR